jgi:hypothetical protein
VSHDICLKAPGCVNYNQRLPGACNRSPGSKLLSITTQLHCGGHLGGKARLVDTILEKDHPMTINSIILNIIFIFYSNMMSFFRFANKRVIYIDGKISLAHVQCTHLSQVMKSQNTFITGGHNFRKGPSNDYSINVSN